MSESTHQSAARAVGGALLATVLAGPLAAAPDCMVSTGAYHPTRVPYTYVLDRRNPYGDDYLDRYQVGMPGVIETGMLTPGHPYFGPVCDLAALRAGRAEPSIEESVRKYRKNAERAEKFVRKARASGARHVLTYICMNTTGGDPEKRTGFWRFYDNWDAFREFSIPPRPREDPETWQQRKADGAPVIAYSRAHPPYRPMFRWTNCINNPAWQTYQRWLTEEAARNGVDGFFVDNAGTLKCYCKHCRAKFAKRLKSRYTSREIEDLFGGDLSMTTGGANGTGLRKAEVQLFWQESIHDFLGKVKKWGSDIHGSFFVFPNGLHRRGYHIATRFRDCDVAMHENSSGDFGGNPGLVNLHIIAGLRVKNVNDHLLAFKYASGTGAHCRANMYSYPGYPKRDLAKLGANANVYALGVAEAAAFGGGGCYAPTGNHAWLAPVREKLNRFFEANAELYRGKYPWGQVGIIGFVLPNYFGDKTTYNGVDQALHLLMSEHILADIIPERVFTPAWIARYAALVVPYCPIMSDRQIQTLARYAKAGGRLILLGKNIAERDQFGREREAENVQRLRTTATAHYEADLSQSLAGNGPLAGVAVCRQPSARLVRMAAYVNDPVRPEELILHCVNYDVDLGTAHNRVGVVHALQLAVPLPPNTRSSSAVFRAPGEAEIQLPVENSGSHARLTVPKLEIYGVIRLALEREAPK